MTPLTQQLEDKKKENYERADSCLWQEIDRDVEEMLNVFFKKWCGNMSAHLSDNDENDGQRLKNFIMMYKNKAEIAILEQAIAEMQKQRQEILDLIDKIEPEIKKDLENPDLKRDEKGIVSGTCHLIKLKIIQQLNQPKEERENV